ncbi:MAG: winged helix-turn-helix transcriptional regulator [Sedimentisphaerales bacterium]|nr:winged helix-turn-helix transcriptional regulator [Sedimentisphaerales bacterium]
MIDSKDIARLLKILSIETRVKMLNLLKCRALCVNALAAQLAITPGAVSQHLRIMRDAGLVIDEKHGYYVHYRLNEKTLVVWREAVEKLLNPKSGIETTKKGNPKCAAVMKNKAVKNRKT